MDDYAGRVLADRYRLPLPPSDEYELTETRAFDTYSGQEVLVRQVPLPEVVEAEVLDAEGLPAGFTARERTAGRPGARPGAGGGPRRPADPVVRRAVEAAQAAASIPDHPRLDQVFDVFAEGGSLWIVSESVAARPLAALLAEKPLTPYRAAEVASDVLMALRVLHAHGWVHRNITARTVMVCDDGRVMLTGLAVGAAEEALCGYDPVPVEDDDPPGNGVSAPPNPAGPPAAGAADPEAARRAAIEARAAGALPPPGEQPGGPSAAVARRAAVDSGEDIRAARAGAIAAYRAGAGRGPGPGGAERARRPARGPHPAGRRPGHRRERRCGERRGDGDVVAVRDASRPDRRPVRRPGRTRPERTRAPARPHPERFRLHRGAFRHPLGRPGGGGSGRSRRRSGPRCDGPAGTHPRPGPPPGPRHRPRRRAGAAGADGRRWTGHRALGARAGGTGARELATGRPDRPRDRPVGARRAALPGRTGARALPGGVHRRTGADGLRRAARLRRGVRFAAARRGVAAAPGPHRAAGLRGTARLAALPGTVRAGARGRRACGRRAARRPQPAADRAPQGRVGAQAPRRSAARPGPRARHKRARPDTGRAPRSLGRTLLLLILLALAAAFAYALLFMPKAGEDGASGTDATQRAGATAPPAGQAPEASSEPRPDQTAPGSGNGASASSGTTQDGTETEGGSDAADGFTVREDEAGFRIAVADGWDRTPKNGRGQIVYTHGDFELIVVPGRDSASANGTDPMVYQREKESELQPYRDSSWATASGLRTTTVGERVMAEGQFTWNDGGRERYVRNLAILLDGRYHVVQVRGPEAERDEVTRLYEQAADSYEYTG
ncbi:protein kinase [Streptomyces antibioticus]|uniref:protein kinase n=1 Tax=Streptomyces antibioticus TaxID=1890 RepID=UPI003D6C0822